MKTCLPLFLAAAGLSLPATVMAKAPEILNYQGRIQTGGVDFTGNGKFKFAIVHNGGVVWLSAADGNADGEPDTAVSVTVANGLFNVGLGDTSLANMAALSLTTPFDTASTPAFTLRLWFNDGVKGFQKLTPDQPLHSVPFARVAATVDDGAISSVKLASNSVTSTKIATGAITASKLAAGAISGLDAPDGNPASAVTVDDAGLVSLGQPETNLIRSTGAALTVGAPDSGLKIIGPSGSFGAGTLVSGEVSNGITAAFDGAKDVAVAGTNVFVVAEADDSFAVINNTDPAAPVILSQMVNGVGGVTSLNEPQGVAVAGNFAFVVSKSASAFTIINVANPAAPVVSAVRTDGAGGFNDMGTLSDVAVAANGNTAFVAAADDDAITIINTATKTNPTLTSVIKNGVNGVTLDNPKQLIVSGTRLYASSASGIVIFSISSLASPAVIASIPSSANAAMALQGNTLFWTGSSTLEVWDVTTATPARLAQESLRDFFPEGFGSLPVYVPTSMSIEGTNLWAVTRTGSLSPRLIIFDITTPSAPVLTNMALGAGVPGNFVNEPFICAPTALAAFDAGRAVVVNATPGAFTTLVRSTSSGQSNTSLVTEGNVGIRVSQPSAALHVNGNGIFEGGSLAIGTTALSVFADGSLSCGNNNVVVGDFSAAIGEGLVTGLSSTGTASMTVIGAFNTPPTSGNPVRFAVGNGDSGARNSAFTVLDNGNIGLNGVPVPTNPLEHSSGAKLTAGGTWTNASDRNLKENLKPVDTARVLEKLRQLPLYEWNYKTEPGHTHTGPMAQDFRAAFALGQDDKTISTVDADGVAMAAIKALIEENRMLRQRVEALEKRAQP